MRDIENPFTLVTQINRDQCIFDLSGLKVSHFRPEGKTPAKQVATVQVAPTEDDGIRKITYTTASASEDLQKACAAPPALTLGGGFCYTQFVNYQGLATFAIALATVQSQAKKASKQTPLPPLAPSELPKPPVETKRPIVDQAPASEPQPTDDSVPLMRAMVYGDLLRHQQPDRSQGATAVYHRMTHADTAPVMLPVDLHGGFAAQLARLEVHPDLEQGDPMVIVSYATTSPSEELWRLYGQPVHRNGLYTYRHRAQRDYALWLADKCATLEQTLIIGAPVAIAQPDVPGMLPTPASRPLAPPPLPTLTFGDLEHYRRASKPMLVTWGGGKSLAILTVQPHKDLRPGHVELVFETAHASDRLSGMLQNIADMSHQTSTLSVGEKTGSLYTYSIPADAQRVRELEIRLAFPSKAPARASDTTGSAKPSSTGDLPKVLEGLSLLNATPSKALTFEAVKNLGLGQPTPVLVGERRESAVVTVSSLRAGKMRLSLAASKPIDALDTMPHIRSVTDRGFSYDLLLSAAQIAQLRLMDVRADDRPTPSKGNPPGAVRQPSSTDRKAAPILSRPSSQMGIPGAPLSTRVSLGQLTTLKNETPTKPLAVGVGSGKTPCELVQIKTGNGTSLNTYVFHANEPVQALANLAVNVPQPGAVPIRYELNLNPMQTTIDFWIRPDADIVTRSSVPAPVPKSVDHKEHGTFPTSQAQERLSDIVVPPKAQPTPTPSVQTIRPKQAANSPRKLESALLIGSHGRRPLGSRRVNGKVYSNEVWDRAQSIFDEIHAGKFLPRTRPVDQGTQQARVTIWPHPKTAGQWFVRQTTPGPSAQLKPSNRMTIDDRGYHYECSLRVKPLAILALQLADEETRQQKSTADAPA